ncbi:UbiX family flavin prenyltransferase [Tunturiibacter gelidiferens]|uniref:UbiX family flavin prenyltransferase n=1 Tax=Tunturiibacter gelidiferens TaxID=3069689 RepID=UPI003D9B3FBA
MKRMVVAITGASGAIYGVRALEVLRAMDDMEVHLVISPSAARTLREETDFTIEDVRGLAHAAHDHKNIGASIASGSFKTEGMIVAPCSVKTLSGIANCYDEDLVIRAADVCLKERRRVVLLFRETPLHAGHISLMDQATRMGAIVMPPTPSFYNRPTKIDDIVNQSVGRLLDLFGLSNDLVSRWTGTSGRPEGARRTDDARSAEPLARNGE